MSRAAPELTDLEIALRLADLADAETLRRFGRAALDVRTKSDRTPVTEADEAAERAIRDELARLRPGDAVVGEEYGGQPSGVGREWVVDPVDGTKNFVRANPVWATLVALHIDGVGRVGVVSAPALGRRWWASAEGAWTSGPSDAVARRCRVSEVTRLEDAFLSYSSLGGWGHRRAAFLDLSEQVWRTRGFGDFLSYCLLAEGSVDIAAEPELSVWDLAAVAVVVTAAGGRLTGLDGIDGPDRGSAVATNGRLHAEVLAALA